LVELQEDNIHTLIESLKDDNDDVKLYTMGIIVDNSKRDYAIDALILFLNYQKNPSVRAKAAWALGKIGNKAAIDPLIVALSDTDEDVRENCITALGRIEAVEAIPFIVLKLKDNSSKVRNEAALILDYLGWKPSNFNEQVQFLIARQQWEKLAHLDKTVSSILLPYLYDEDLEVVRGVCYTLGELRSELAIQPLFDFFMNIELKELQEHIANALAKIGGEKTVELLIVATYDEDWFIRKCAVEALGEIGDLFALNPLLDMRNDPNSYVQKSVERAIEKLRAKVRRLEEFQDN